MDIYTDYANWKFENHEFIHSLVERKSVAISRFTSVIVVVDYLYEKYLKKNKLTEDEQVFFEIGFDYIHDNFYTIKTLLDYQFNKDYDKLDACAKTINLLLYVNEFQAELLNHDVDLKNEMKLLDGFEQQISEFLAKNENVPDEYFPILNDIVNPIFDRHNIEFIPIESIFYEVALEYRLYKENEFDMYNAVLNLQKEKTKNGN